MVLGAGAANAGDRLAGAAHQGSEGSAANCQALAAQALPDTVAITAVLVPAGQGVGDQADLPAFCRVSLTVREAINIEVWLPTATYNGRFQAVGGGGYDGAINYRSMATALRAGYATTSTDSGHGLSGATGTFALDPDGSLNDQLIEDFASRAVIEMTLKAKSLIASFYGADAEYSYWNGCSNGGRQGMVLAQQLPDA